MKNKTSLLTCACLVSLIFGCNNQSQLIEKNKSIAEQFTQLWTNHDSIKLASLFAKDFIYRDMAFGMESKTREQLISFVNGTIKGVPDFKIVPTTIVANDSIVSIEWKWTGTFVGGWGPDYPGNNKSFNIQGVSVVKIKNGLITRNYDYYDKEPFRKTDTPK
jgi:steroid delta-isomerase-like uncharacterized protein